MRLTSLIWLSILAISSAPAWAVPGEGGGSRRVIQPELALVQATSRRFTDPFKRIHAVIRVAEGVAVGPLLADLEARGVGTYLGSRDVLQVGSWLPVKIPVALASTLAEDPRVVAISAQMAGPQPFYEDAAPEMIVAPRWARPRHPDGRPVTGQKIAVGVIDGDLDVLHPAFFYADAGLWSWVDVDEDGGFTPGVDGVVLEDGTLSSLHVLQSRLFLDPRSPSPIEPAGSGDFQVDVDYLYLDLNGNGKRDVGRAAGFDEASPGYGEPIFVIDDVDADGVLEPGEKLVQLGTSKLRVYYKVDEGVAYWRGIDLIDVPRPVEHSHGTMTVGILAGGNTLGQRFQGVAPGIEIVYVDRKAFQQTQSETDPIGAAMAFLAQEQVDVMMHEYGWPVGQFNDGSSEHELMIDALSAEGIVQLTAAHNFAAHPMHGVATASGGEKVDFPIRIDLGHGSPTMLYLMLRWRGDVDPVAFEFLHADGSFHTFDATSEEIQEGDLMIQWSGVQVSERGTKMVFMVVGRVQGAEWGPLPAGDAFLSAVIGPTDPVTLDLFASDETGYMYYAALLDHLSPVGTVSHPSTADSAITVGAFQANLAIAGAIQGAHSPYSGQGPRIDGPLAIDISAPSDGIGASVMAGMDGPTLATSGGTSGALPQVTGVVALMRSLEPELSPADVKARIQESARMDAHTGVAPNNAWGFGKLSAAGALAQPLEEGNTAPKVTLTLLEPAYLGEPILLTAALSVDVEDPPETLRVRWDEGYTGKYTAATTLDATITLTPLTAPGTRVVVVEVFDPAGAGSRERLEVEVLDARPPPPPDVVEETGSDVGTENPEQTPETGAPSPAESDTGCAAATSSGGLWWCFLVMLWFVLTVTRRTRLFMVPAFRYHPGHEQALPDVSSDRLLHHGLRQDHRAGHRAGCGARGATS